MTELHTCCARDLVFMGFKPDAMEYIYNCMKKIAYKNTISTTHASTTLTCLIADLTVVLCYCIQVVPSKDGKPELSTVADESLNLRYQPSD